MAGEAPKAVDEQLAAVVLDRLGHEQAEGRAGGVALEKVLCRLAPRARAQPVKKSDGAEEQAGEGACGDWARRRGTRRRRRRRRRRSSQAAPAELEADALGEEVVGVEVDPLEVEVFAEEEREQGDVQEHARGRVAWIKQPVVGEAGQEV
jgi:hypothetical protein